MNDFAVIASLIDCARQLSQHGAVLEQFDSRAYIELSTEMLRAMSHSAPKNDSSARFPPPLGAFQSKREDGADPPPRTPRVAPCLRAPFASTQATESTRRSRRLVRKKLGVSFLTSAR